MRGLCGLLLVFLSCVFLAVSGQPNIVVVLVDDMRWDDFSLSEAPSAIADLATPGIDRIGREGIRFRNAFATTPLCSPSRASILTGKYAHSHGIFDNLNRSRASHDLNTFPKILQKHGYRTGFVGKWHMGNDPTPRPGFDYWCSLKGQGIAQDPDLFENDKFGSTRGYVTDLLTDKAEHFIRDKPWNRSTHKPFALFFAHKALHPNFHQLDNGTKVNIGDGGFIAAERHQHLFSDSTVRRRLNAFNLPTGKPALQQNIPGLPELQPSLATPEKDIKDRLKMLMAVDESTSRLMDILTETDELDKTVFVLLSDHGYWYGEFCLNEERRLPYEESLRIPFLIRYPPKFSAGLVIDEMALTIDLAPTLLELAGIRDTPPDIQGQSLVGLLGDPHHGWKPLWRRSFLVEYYSDTVFPRMRTMGYKAVRTTRYLYIHFEELDNMDELYDLKTDPYQRTNIINLPSAQRLLQSLQQELRELLQTEPPNTRNILPLASDLLL
eukprot:TRINITY_DN1851_c0_g1_i1.p1 TRINITY_DN1851_c0_g1~~TRINITY_DN1851_c0_g1_i1.p1  ORF type:complete len:508 (-),score=70.16 TRINITY_DN1851_c0_g1_i1:1122-2606(-)